MVTGWYADEGDVYYLGDEDDGARKENQWLWLERPGNADDDHSEAASVLGCTDDDSNPSGDEGPVYVARIKVDSEKMGKQYYAFDEYGRNLTGLQYSPDDNGFYYFDDNGYPKFGKVSSVDCDDDSYEFYFTSYQASAEMMLPSASFIKR